MRGFWKHLCLNLILTVMCSIYLSSLVSATHNPYEEFKSYPMTYSKRVYYEMHKNMPAANLFKSEREELFTAIEKLRNKETVNMKEVEGGFFSPRHYEKTGPNSYLFRYTGEMSGNKPDGIGVLERLVARNTYVPAYIGHFVDGVLDGFGIMYSHTHIKEYGKHPEAIYYNHYMLYEGEFEDGEPQGEGVFFSYAYLDDNDSGMSGQLYTFVGEFDGFSVDGTYDVYLTIEGQTKYPEYFGLPSDRKVNLSNALTFLCYKGEVKNAKFNGNGTSYYEDGSIHYKGTFEMNKPKR